MRVRSLDALGGIWMTTALLQNPDFMGMFNFPNFPERLEVLADPEFRRRDSLSL